MSTLSDSDRWNEGLKLVSFCPVCETRYNPMEARALAGIGETQLLHVQCRKCQNAILAIVHVNQVGASSVGLLTDLSYEDVVRFRSQSVVKIDDVIETHRFFGSDHWEQALGGTYRNQVTRVMRKREKHLQEHITAR
ncbi:hypothetical protein HZA87_05595 [Candidatus Uhrbacteria bacterium]|nr:hypothetical protein [Candidatus Uhrbacteria bacterium]